MREEVPPNANMINGSFVSTINNVYTDQPIFKARFVAHRNRDPQLTHCTLKFYSHAHLPPRRYGIRRMDRGHFPSLPAVRQ